MTNEEMIADLKQFISATVSQQTVQLEQRMNNLEGRIDGLHTGIKGIKADVTRLDEKVDAVQQAIADTLTHAIEAVDTTEQVKDHEQRLRRLERRAA